VGNFEDSLDQAVLNQEVLELLPKARSSWQYWSKEKTEDQEKNCSTIPYLLTDRQLLKHYLSDSKMIALPLGAKTRYFILDIDSNSGYNNTDSVLHLFRLFESRHIILHACQSSLNQGIHLIGIFTRHIHVKRLIPFLAPFLEHHGFIIAGGQLEVWPSKTTQNRPIRLPFQNQKGYYLLDPHNDLNVARWPISPEDNISIFLSLEQNDPDVCNLKPPLVKLKQSPVKPIEQSHLGQNFDFEKYDMGKRFYEEGLTAPSQRQEALECISYYLFFNGYGYDHKEERYDLLVEWMSEKNNGYSREWNCQPKTVLKKIRSIADSEPRDRQRLRNNSFPYYEYNTQRAAECESRIALASKELALSGELYLKNGRINRRAIETRANVNRRTAQRYQELIERESQKAIGNLQEELMAG